MTYGLDLFSDAPPASMPTTAFIPMSGAVLLGMWAWMRDRRVVLGYVFILLGALFATTARAEEYPAISPGWTYGQNTACHATGCFPEPLQAVGAFCSSIGKSADVNNSYQVSSVQWRGYCGVMAYAHYVNVVRTCPGGGTLEYYSNVCVGAPQCSEGQVRDSETGLCGAPPCQAGEVSQLNLGVGYAKTTANVDDWIDPQFYTTSCNAGCQVTVGAIVPGSCGVGGLIGPPYPGYCEFQTTTTGSECTASDEATTEPLPQIPCPQGMQAGTVNGVAGCYAVSTATKETTVTDNGDGTTTTTETVTGPTGTTTTTTTCNGEGACSSTTTHVGGGGTTSAPGEIGQDYDGSPEGEEEGEGACGKEGLPDCKVKVNEDGTPQEVEGMQAALDGVLQGVQEQFDYLGGMGWVREELPFVWNPSFPSGSCAAVEIHGYQIDICEPLGKARMVWAFVLAFMAGLYIWRQATEVMKGS